MRVRIPRSSARRVEACYAKLLERVEPDAHDGFGYLGSFLKPGSTIEESELWPTPHHPPVPVILECCLLGESGWGHKRSLFTYILWKYSAGKFEEIARTKAQHWEWAIELREAAIRALEVRGKFPVVLPDIEALAGRIQKLLTVELAGLDLQDQRKILAVLHDYFAVHLVLEGVEVCQSVSPVSNNRTTDRQTLLS